MTTFGRLGNNPGLRNRPAFWSISQTGPKTLAGQTRHDGIGLFPQSTGCPRVLGSLRFPSGPREVSLPSNPQGKVQTGMSGKQPPKILIADDNPQGAELLEAYLDGFPCEVRVVRDGEQTLKEAASFVPDLILLDIMMPKISGFEVCKRLRADPQLRGTRVIMVTALDQDADAERAVEAGADDFISKPIPKVDLLLRVKALLSVENSASDLERTLGFLKAVQTGLV